MVGAIQFILVTRGVGVEGGDVSSRFAIDLVIYVYKNKQLRVRVYLDRARVSDGTKSANQLIMKHLFFLQ